MKNVPPFVGGSLPCKQSAERIIVFMEFIYYSTICHGDTEAEEGLKYLNIEEF